MGPAMPDRAGNILLRTDAPAGAAVGLSLENRFAQAGLSEEVLAEIKSACRANGSGLMELLLQRKALTETQILDIFSAHFHLPLWLDLPVENINPEFTNFFPIQYLKKNKMVPLTSPDDNRVVVAVNDPFRFQFIDDFCRVLGKNNPLLVLSSQEAIVAAINLAYDLSRSSAKEFFQEMTDETPEHLISEIEETADLLDETSEAPIIKLVNLLVSGAIRDRSSDIHIEPYQNVLRVR